MRHLLRHLLRITLWTALLIAALPYPPLAAVVAAFVFFAVFSVFHDAAHGALGLPPLANDVLLFATSIPLFMSAHGQRQLHLRHHARPLADDDLEGAGALVSLPWAAITAPFSSVHMRVASFGAVNERVRPWVAAENVANVVVVALVLAVGNEGLQLAVLTWLVLQLTMNAWASHVPHRAPQWLLKAASVFAFTGSPVVLSLVYHLEHHAHPKVPCADLRADLAVESPLLEAAVQQPIPLPWAQLSAERPRPRSPMRLSM